MTEVVYSITVLGCNNFFPYEDKTLCVAWKAKKQKGETAAATVRHNNADLKSVFRVDAKLKPARKKEGEYERCRFCSVLFCFFPLSFSFSLALVLTASFES